MRGNRILGTDFYEGGIIAEGIGFFPQSFDLA